MDFTTKVPISSYDFPIHYESELWLLGSCFAENIGEKFSYFKFRTQTNPFGIIFNPVSLEKLIDRVVNQRLFGEADIFFYNDLWHCYEVHSELSHPDKDFFLHRLNQRLKELHLQVSTFLHGIITLGSAWVYRHNSTQEIVANCHKVPQKEFAKEILSPETIRQSLENIMALLHKVNPNCQFIFTVSPVRHIKDGFTENQRSKAHLITAVNNLATGNYFPAYEIMMDELRDYRFYAEDMLHPSQTAIDYIWERFSKHYISSESLAVMQEVDSIQKGLGHRPFNPDTANHQKFLATLNQKIVSLQEQFPHFQF